MCSIGQAVRGLKEGKFVLVHDNKHRENEVDMVIAAEHIKPSDIALMRNHAGGLICMAVANEITQKLGLAYMSEILRSFTPFSPILSRIISTRSPYGDSPAFSISINHRDTFTGITDIDRALTISRFAKICRDIDSGGIEQFAGSFIAPGHVPILIASPNLFEERTGHTELSIFLMQLAGLVPAAAICEMLDPSTHRALSINEANNYAKRSGIVLLESDQIIHSYSKVT